MGYGEESQTEIITRTKLRARMLYVHCVWLDIIMVPKEMRSHYRVLSR